MRNFVALAFVTLGMTLIGGSALAGGSQIAVPEPLSMSLLAGGIVAIAAVKRMRRR